MSKPTLPDGYPLTALYRQRVRQNRDLTILISDYNLERGSGKTTLALRLAAAMDRTDEGITTNKATLSPEELIESYTREPEGSALVLDEAEAGASNRRSMSSVNEALRKLISMGRVEEKYTLLTTPGGHMIDKDVRAMADVWILVTELGEGQVYQMRYNPFGDHPVTDGWDTIEWSPDLPGELKDVYDYLTEEKRKRLRGDSGDGDGFVRESEVEDRMAQLEEETERQTRDEIIRNLYRNFDKVTQSELAEAVGLSRSRIGDIVTDSA